MSKTNTTRSLFAVDAIARTISASKTALKRAQNPNSAEYIELNLLRADNPDFEITEKKPKKAKESYDGMGFEFMRDFILAQPDSEKMLVEFECVKTTNCNRYAPVKKWFLDTYKDENGKFDMVKAKAEITESRIKRGQDMAKSYFEKQIKETAQKIAEALPVAEPTLSIAKAANQ